MVENFYVKFGDMHRLLRYRADKETDKQTNASESPTHVMVWTMNSSHLVLQRHGTAVTE